jgi:hypothetical protein
MSNKMQNALNHVNQYYRTFELQITNVDAQMRGLAWTSAGRSDVSEQISTRSGRTA